MRLRLFVWGLLVVSIAFRSTIFGQETPNGQTNHTYHSPLDIPLVLSGNFGEIRSNHFHSGMDFRTNGKIGLNVYAIEDGYVSRIYVSGSGYGKAIYITHPNGITSVYGHLNGFAPKVNEKVLEQHYAKESYKMNAFFEPGEIPVSKGEVVGFSGNAGSSSGPHLHFEIRDTQSEDILDPMDFGLPIKDTKSPQITRIRIFPINQNGLVEGKLEAASYSTVFFNNQFHLKGDENVVAWGDLGIGVEALDYLDGSWAKNGISELKVYVDNELTYHHSVKRFAFAESRYINTLIDYELYKQYSRKYMRTYKAEPNNPLSIYKTLKNDGIISVHTPGKKDIKIVAIDAAGNSSTLAFHIKAKKQDIPKLYPLDIENLVRWDTTTIVEKDGLLLKFPAKSLYSDQDITIKTTKNENLLSPIYTIGKTTIPVQKSYSIAMQLNKAVSDSDKVYIARVYKGKAGSALSTQRKGHIYTTSNRSLGGSYALATDTKAPTIESLDIYNGKKMTGAKQIRFKMRDEGSGIQSYEGRIDGKWALFEQYQYSSNPTYYFDDQRLEKGKHHTLTFTVTDNVGNKATYNATFYW